tara:strand:- start:2397 stop:2603 length:207 start_codon:yes stop_codon:yes gene_type:complete
MTTPHPSEQVPHARDGENPDRDGPVDAVQEEGKRKRNIAQEWLKPSGPDGETMPVLSQQKTTSKHRHR